MKKAIFVPLAALALVACTAKAEPNNYKVTVDEPSLENGSMVYLLDYDTSENIDSTVVADGKAVFAGRIENPAFVRLVSDGNRMGMFVLEQGDINVAGGDATGTPLNTALNDYAEKVNALSAKMQMLSPDDAAGQQQIYTEYAALTDSMKNANIDNPIGYYFFMQEAYEMDRDQFNAALAKNPSLNNYKRVQKMKSVYDSQDATAPGKMFTDFEVTYDGNTHRLSDYVGKGNYTLVDFWASWCGPCMRKMPHLKEIYSQYAPKGLEVLGVAVWDEPAKSLATIDKLELPWKQIIDAQTIPTDIYGILGIPCIILFGPDGTIIARNPEDAELNAILEEVYAPKPLAFAQPVVANDSIAAN